MATQAAPRSLRALMADREIYTYADLARRAKVPVNIVTLLTQGWRATDTIAKRLAKVLGVTVEEIRGAASLAHKAVAQ